MNDFEQNISIRDNRRVYSIGFNANVPQANGDGGATWSVSNDGKEFKLISLLFILKLSDNNWPNGANIPIEQNTTQQYNLQVRGRPYPGMLVTNPMIPAVPVIAGSILNNGEQFLISQPGQYIFKSFFIKDYLDFIWQYHNIDLINASWYQAQFIIEVEDKK